MKFFRQEMWPKKEESGRQQKRREKRRRRNRHTETHTQRRNNIGQLALN